MRRERSGHLGGKGEKHWGFLHLRYSCPDSKSSCEKLHFHKGALGGPIADFYCPCMHTLNFSSPEIKADVQIISQEVRRALS